MTLDGAIKVVTKIRNGETVTGGEYMRGMKLGIEALEKEKNMRMCHKVLHPADHCELPLLPSETE